MTIIAQNNKKVNIARASLWKSTALARKCPNADREWGWQYIFPASSLSQDPRSGITRRHHLHESSLQKAVKEAARLVGIVKPVGPQTLTYAVRFVSGSLLW